MPAFLTLSSILLLVQPLTNGKVIVVTQLWLAASPFFDALITLFVIKQYRTQAVAYFCNIFIAKKCLKPKRTSILELSNNINGIENRLNGTDEDGS